jgi:Uma2 family endonuclease
VVGLLLSWLVHVFGSEYTRIQSTIDVSQASPLYDEPEPDAAVTAEPNTAYADHHPEPEDLLLVIEVSDSTVRFDRSTKAALYARAGIADYWVVDLPGRRIVVHRQPSGNGYGEITAYTAEERVAPLVRPADTILVADLLPPAVE